jgi:hypothetical protein
MRLSSLVFPAILFASGILFAQHTSGGGGSAGFGGSSGSGAYHGYSGGSGSSASSASSHSSSNSAAHVSSTGVASSHSSTSSRVSSTKGSASPEKKSSRSFFHPFRKPKPVQSAEFKRPVPCLKGPCAICPPGGSRKGACVVTTNVCPAAQSWNGACGFPYGFNDCSALAERLAAERRYMRGQSDPGQALLYRLLLQQLESCMARYGSHAYSSASMFDTLLDTP